MYVLFKLLQLTQVTEAAKMAVYREQLSHGWLGQVAEAGVGSHVLSRHSHSQQSYEPALEPLSRKTFLHLLPNIWHEVPEIFQVTETSAVSYTTALGVVGLDVC